MFELVIVWKNGTKNVYEYETEQKAQEIGEFMKIALGDQITWYGTRKKVN